MKFKQLTSEQRYQISALLALNFSQAEIAKQLSVNRSTMSREIKRNSVEKVYSPEAVSRLTQQRRQQALKSMLKPYRNYVHTLTFDNGLEFAAHEKIATYLDAKTYFGHPYSSWERGLNENFNGLLRQYIPKGTDLRKVSHKRVKLVA